MLTNEQIDARIEALAEGDSGDDEVDGLIAIIREMQSAVEVVIRHPDHGNDYHSFGYAVEGVDLDMGQSFDGSKLSWDCWDEVLSWAVSEDGEADRIATINAEAASFIRGVIEETLAECLPYPGDNVTEIEGLPYDPESCDVRPFLDAAKRRGA